MRTVKQGLKRQQTLGRISNKNTCDTCTRNSSHDEQLDLAASPTFLPGQTDGQIELLDIGEASGLAASRKNDDVF
ncbi:MAG: hypothetical protein ABGX16_01125 [Pirellulales bacterium]